ncbi:ABC transporter permease [Nocardioides KLBMP 9356]|uniref:ABC transporter permease n=1 Tax=Nocardioides potassii TaxID=2911371 RepID=A0ABS9HDK5_9ACTN|nr:ABC transporter permease [Nocardioides potassii]MCF6379267.1 ABC transporter permease [Nocardioides potassii]
MRGWRSRSGHGWSPTRHAWRAAWGHRRPQALALVAISTLITACTAFAPAYDRAMQQALVDTLLAHATPADAAVVLVSESGQYPGGSVDSRDPRELDALFPEEVAAHTGPAVLGRTAIVTPEAGDNPPSGVLMWRNGQCDHVRILDGTCPDEAGEILVSRDDVDNFDLRVGAVRQVGTAVDDSTVRLEVVGTYVPDDDGTGEGDGWWLGERTTGVSAVVRGLDPSASHDAWLTVEQTFVDAPLLTGESSQAGAAVAAASADVDEVLELAEGIRALTAGLYQRREDVQLRSGIVDLTDTLRDQVAQAHRTVPLLLAPLAVLSVFVLWLVLSAATSERRGEVAVARLRGRGPAGAAALLLLELLPALLVGVVPGALVALAGGVVAKALLPGAWPLEVAPGFATALLLAVAAIVVTTVAAAARTAREPLHDVVRSGPVATSRWALGAVEAFVVACVGTGVLAFVTGSLQGPLALAGPALLALLTGLLVAHLVAPLGRALGRRLLTSGRLVAGSSLLDTGRRGEGRTVIVVVTVACALAVFAMDALAIGARNRTVAAEHEAGGPVVLQVTGGDVDGVRAALHDADPTGTSAAPVLVARDTLAVEPGAFRRVAFFPRGGPSDQQWRALAPPDREPDEIRGTRVALEVGTAEGFTAADIFGSEVEVNLGLVVTAPTGIRRTIPLGNLPPAGSSRTARGTAEACAGGCTLVAVRISTAQGATVAGDLELSRLRVDGRPADWGTSSDDWNAFEDQDTLIQPAGSGADGVLRVGLGLSGFYPVEMTSAWVPSLVPALISSGQNDPIDKPLAVTGPNGDDRLAVDAGQLRLVPAMPKDTKLVGLESLVRGAAITPDSHLEVWLDDDPALEDGVRGALLDQGIAITEVRRYADVRQAYQDTVSAWSLSLGAAVAPAVGLLALLVLLVLALIGWRGRARDLAILRLNGVDRRTTRRLAVWTRLPPVLIAVVGGVVAGLAGAEVAMPDVTLLPAPPEVPLIDLATSWPAVVAVTAGCLVVLPVTAALAGLVVVRQAHVERVREGA